MKTVVFIFGRLNPATIGHAKLLDAAYSIAIANKADYKVYLSKTHKPPKDPLTYDQKREWFKKSFPQYAKNLQNDKTVNNPFQVIMSLVKAGYENIIMLCGSDRVAEYREIFKKYTTKDETKVTDKILYLPDYSVISLDRDPDADDASGMSASKLRNFVKERDFDSFTQGVSKKLSKQDIKKYFNDIYKGMNL